VNFLHRAEDASKVFDTLITHRAVKTCNFTDSTQVGRIIASQAAMALKPVLLELGGKNFTIVLEDANLDLAVQEIVKGAFLNVSEKDRSHRSREFRGVKLICSPS
jgi:acyl-CoA reductase-like NAD-dependent aldehyde dehydrogenase